MSIRFTLHAFDGQTKSEVKKIVTDYLEKQLKSTIEDIYLLTNAETKVIVNPAFNSDPSNQGEYWICTSWDDIETEDDWDYWYDRELVELEQRRGKFF